jgi:hypothetical protein
LDGLAAPTDVTTLNATTGQHGLLPKLGGGVTNYLRADGTWAAPAGAETQKTVSYATSQLLSVAECNGYVVYVTGAATISLQPIADGMSVTVITIGNVAVSVDPNVADKIWLDGAPLADGYKITNGGAAGDIAVLTYYSADGWHASTNGWTDGGA